MRRDGELNDNNVMDTINWPVDHPLRGKSHNHLVVNRRRCIILTNKYWVQMEYAERQQRIADAQASLVAKENKATATVARKRKHADERDLVAELKAKQLVKDETLAAKNAAKEAALRAKNATRPLKRPRMRRLRS
jgi:hypothetical protein